jgi:hypothetical protein
MIDAPGGGGKIPVMPNYLISYSDHKVILRNYEGYITTYEEPQQYTPHDSARCKYCQHPRSEPGQVGVSGLLQGERLWIEPAGFEQTHRRGNESAHRLQDPSKWVPYGVGPIEGKAGQPLPGIEPGPNGQAPGDAVVGDAAGASVPETAGAASEPPARHEPRFEYAPGEEPRPREGEPTGWSHGELL